MVVTHQIPNLHFAFVQPCSFIPSNDTLLFVPPHGMVVLKVDWASDVECADLVLNICVNLAQDMNCMYGVVYFCHKDVECQGECPSPCCQRLLRTAIEQTSMLGRL